MFDESRRNRAAGRWKKIAAVLPLSILVGEVFYASLSSLEALRGAREGTPVLLGVIVVIFVIAVLRQTWLRPLRVKQGAPTPAMVARTVTQAYRFLGLVWLLAAAQALLGAAILLAGGPRTYAWFLFALSLMYLGLQYPRRTLFETLLPFEVMEPELAQAGERSASGPNEPEKASEPPGENHP